MFKYKKSLLAIGLALSVGSVFAQSSGGDSGGQGGGNTASTMTFQQWLNNQSAKGRVTRKMYMDESARRWDSMDRRKQGLTADEINQMYYQPNSGGMGGPTATNSQEKKGIQK